MIERNVGNQRFSEYAQKSKVAAMKVNTKVELHQEFSMSKKKKAFETGNGPKMTI